MDLVFSTVTKIVGVTFGNRQALLSELSDGDTLTFVHRPNNKYDENAIAVYNEYDEQLGFINSELAEEIAQFRDFDPDIIIEGYVKNITGGDKSYYGCNIAIEVLGDCEKVKAGRDALFEYEDDLDDFGFVDYETAKRHKQREISIAEHNDVSSKGSNLAVKIIVLLVVGLLLLYLIMSTSMFWGLLYFIAFILISGVLLIDWIYYGTKK